MEENKKNLVVLVVEDEKDLLDMYEQSFKTSGFDVIATNSGEQALKELEKTKNQIDVILLDLLLPGISGFEVLDIIRKKNALKNIPVIVASNLSENKDKERAFELGANEYFVKMDKTPSQIVKDVATICCSNNFQERKKVKIFN